MALTVAVETPDVAERAEPRAHVPDAQDAARADLDVRGRVGAPDRHVPACVRNGGPGGLRRGQPRDRARDRHRRLDVSTAGPARVVCAGRVDGRVHGGRHRAGLLRGDAEPAGTAGIVVRRRGTHRLCVARWRPRDHRQGPGQIHPAIPSRHGDLPRSVRLSRLGTADGSGSRGIWSVAARPDDFRGLSDGRCAVAGHTRVLAVRRAQAPDRNHAHRGQHDRRSRRRHDRLVLGRGGRVVADALGAARLPVRVDRIRCGRAAPVDGRAERAAPAVGRLLRSGTSDRGRVRHAARADRAVRAALPPARHA